MAPPADTPQDTASANRSVTAATAVAQPNIALVKYWGKRDTRLNIPAGGSLSITLADLHTRTTVTVDPSLKSDELVLNGQPAPERLPKVTAVLDALFAHVGRSSSPPSGMTSEPRSFARVVSANDFPTGAGLASSASGFAALVVAADAAFGLGLPATRLSEFARRGSGSAARSLFGGFVELAAGTRADGSDAVARPLLAADAWPLTVVIAVTSTSPKTVSSGAGMELSRTTSPFYDSWIDGNSAALAEAHGAIEGRDFARLAAVAEASSYAMHAVMLATRPALMYWNGSSVECLRTIRELRESRGLATFSTVDAGPQVKAVCLPGDAAAVAEALAQVPGVIEVRSTGLGAGARIESAGIESAGTQP